MVRCFGFVLFLFFMLVEVLKILPESKKNPNNIFKVTNLNTYYCLLFLTMTVLFCVTSVDQGLSTCEFQLLLSLVQSALNILYFSSYLSSSN